MSKLDRRLGVELINSSENPLFTDRADLVDRDFGAFAAGSNLGTTAPAWVKLYRQRADNHLASSIDFM